MCPESVLAPSNNGFLQDLPPGAQPSLMDIHGTADDIIPANISNSFEYNCSGAGCTLPPASRFGGPNRTTLSESSWLYIPQENLSRRFAAAADCIGAACAAESTKSPAEYTQASYAKTTSTTSTSTKTTSTISTSS